MILRIIFTFVLFAGIVYYFNIDVRNLVEKSGVPAWLASHNVATGESSTGSTTTAL